LRNRNSVWQGRRQWRNSINFAVISPPKRWLCSVYVEIAEHITLAPILVVGNTNLMVLTPMSIRLINDQDTSGKPKGDVAQNICQCTVGSVLQASAMG